MICIKLGGSVLTDKASPTPKAARETIKRLAEELANAPMPWVLVHGAGSYGHPAAKRYGFGHTPVDAPRGAAEEVRRAVRDLHAIVLEALSENGVPSRSFEPPHLLTVKDGEIGGFDGRAPRSAALGGQVPVTFGDLMPDDSGGWSVVSGDDLTVHLADALDARLVLFVTDVDGLMTAPPGKPGSKLIPDLDAIPADVEVHTATTDVTGGLDRKVRLIRSLKRPDRTVGIINGAVPGRLADAVAGEEVVGTWLKGG